MRTPLGHLLGVMLLSLLLYGLGFLFVLKKPLTVGAQTQYVALKRHYLQATAGQPRILIFAGSNGRFSHSCATIERTYQVRCVNLSLAAGSRLTWQFQHYADLVFKGDLLYLPLEYREPADREHEGHVTEEAPYIVEYEHSALTTFYRPREALEAIFGFDLRYAVCAVAEMLMDDLGVRRRFSVATMDQQGDEIGHTLQKARAYRDYVTSMAPIHVDALAYTSGANWSDESQLIALAQSRGALVVGGLPTTTEDADIPPVVDDFLSAFYHGRGACFLEPPSRNLYPRSDFYDSQYHLAEPYQVAHTASIAAGLVAILARGAC